MGTDRNLDKQVQSLVQLHPQLSLEQAHDLAVIAATLLKLPELIAPLRRVCTRYQLAISCGAGSAKAWHAALTPLLTMLRRTALIRWGEDKR